MMSDRKTVNIKNWGYAEIQSQEGHNHSINIYTEKNIFKLHIEENYEIRYLVLRLKEILAIKQDDLDDTIRVFETGLRSKNEQG